MNRDPEGNRRGAPRIKVNAAFSESDPRTTTLVRDLSRTGAFVETERLYALGARIELSFVVLPEEPTLVQHAGRVVRISRWPKGVGVQLDPLTPELEALFKRLLAAGGGRRMRTSARSKRLIRIDTGTVRRE